MIDLSVIIRDLIATGMEGDHWDFKRDSHAKPGDLIKDIMCLANTPRHAGDRYIVYGVDDTGSVVGMTSGHRRTQADIVNTLSTAGFAGGVYPDIYLQQIELQGQQLDVVVIKDRPEKPYYLQRGYHKDSVRLNPGTVYARVRDSNTPSDQVASSHDIEQMWRQRFGLDLSPLNRMKLYLSETDFWVPINRLGENLLEHHRIFPEFTLRVTDAEDFMACNEEWTRAEIRRDNNYAAYYEVQYHQTCLARMRYVSFDDHKKSMIAPNWEPRGAGRFYYYESNSINYAVQQWHAIFVQQDHSRTLSIRGSGDAADQARLRWGRHLTIPVVSKEEVDEFIGKHNEQRHSKPSSDQEKQYELFLLNLLDFEDWRQ